MRIWRFIQSILSKLKLRKIEMLNPIDGSFVSLVSSVQIRTKFPPDQLQIWIYSNGSRKWYPQSTRFQKVGNCLTADGLFGLSVDPCGTIFWVTVLRGWWTVDHTFDFLPPDVIKSQMILVFRKGIE